LYTVPAGKVRVNVAYSPINPYDHIVAESRKEEGFCLGIEGSGTIIEVGEGVDPKLVG